MGDDSSQDDFMPCKTNGKVLVLALGVSPLARLQVVELMPRWEW